MKKFLSVLFLLTSLTVGAYAQDQRVGGSFTIGHNQYDGVAFSANADLVKDGPTYKGIDSKLLFNIGAHKVKKGYRDQFGNGWNGAALIRLGVHKNIYVEGGTVAGYVSYADINPGDGYTKTSFRPAVGAGVRFKFFANSEAIGGVRYASPNDRAYDKDGKPTFSNNTETYLLHFEYVWQVKGKLNGLMQARVPFNKFDQPPYGRIGTIDPSYTLGLVWKY